MRALMLLLLLAGCPKNSEAPTMGAPDCAPLTLVVGMKTTVTCTFTFSDAQADIVDVDVEFNNPNGGALTTQTIGFQHPGEAMGTAMVSFPLTCPAAGNGVAQLELVDSPGHASEQQRVDFFCGMP